MSENKMTALYENYLKLSLEDLKELASATKKEESYFYAALISLRMEGEWEKAFDQ